MSLDLLHCKIVEPTKANAVFDVTDHPYMQAKLQQTGYLTVWEHRIGRNCLNSDWHHLYNAIFPSDRDDDLTFDNWQLKHDAMVIVLPSEFAEKIQPFLSTFDGEPGIFFNYPETEPDFYFIDW